MDYNFKTLNYLGSKLRLLDFIAENVAEVTPVHAGICDLFAGSGCVSRMLSRNYEVTACDIQNYSKVICDALLGQSWISVEDCETFLATIESMSLSKLGQIFMPMIEIESKAIGNRDIEILAQVVEHGSVEVYNIDRTESVLSSALNAILNNLEKYSIDSADSLISRYYGGVYFSYFQAVQIDLIRKAINRFPNRNCKNLLMAALLSTASDIVDTVGKHFAQPIKARNSKGEIKNIVYTKAVKDKTMDVLSLYKEWLERYRNLSQNGLNHKTVQGDFSICLQNLPDNVCTVYADPPYTREHYSRYYHVLETLSLGDIPEITKVTSKGLTRVSNGIYRNNRHQSPFCIKSKALAAFGEIFNLTAMHGRNLLLSYSPYDETKKTHPRVATMSQLICLAKEFFKKVEIVSAGHFAHSKLNSTKYFLDSSDEAELLIVCLNN